MSSFRAPAFEGTAPSPRALNAARLRAGQGAPSARPSPSAVRAAAAAAASASSSPLRSPVRAAAGAALAGGAVGGAGAYTPRSTTSVAVAGARGRWNHLIESADDEVRSIMTPPSQPGFGGLDGAVEMAGFGDLGLDDMEKAALEASLRRQRKIEGKLKDAPPERKSRRSRDKRTSPRSRRREGSAGEGKVHAPGDAAAAAAAVATPRRRARGFVKPRVAGGAGDEDWADEDAEVAGMLPPVRDATPTEAAAAAAVQRHHAAPPGEPARSSPRGGPSQRRRGQGCDAGGGSAGSGETAGEESLVPSSGADAEGDDEDKMQKLRAAMDQMDQMDAGGTAGGDPALRREAAASEAAERRAAAAAVAEAKAKAQAAVKEAARAADAEAAAKREAELRGELRALKLGQLCTRAMKAGVEASALEEAQDSDTPKDAVIGLLLKLTVPQLGAAPLEPEPEPEPEPKPEQSAASPPNGASGKVGPRTRRSVQLACPDCATTFKAHAPVKQKRTRKCRCGGCGEALTVGYCPGCAELTVWTAAARTHQNASCSSCFAAFHVAKCPGCSEVAAHVGTHADAEFGAGLSPHTGAKVPGAASAAATSTGLVCEHCSLRFFESGCPACGAWTAHPARLLTSLRKTKGGGGRGGPELECEHCSHR